LTGKRPRRHRQPFHVLALIERMAFDPRADVEKLECMMAMYERLKAKEAEFRI